MTNLPHVSPSVVGLQTRLVIETLTQVIPGTEIVEIVAESDETIPGFDVESWAAPGSENSLSHIRKRVLGQLGGLTAVGSFSCMISGVAWGVLVEAIEVQDGAVMGALVVARQGRAWSSRERALVKAFGGLLSHAATLSTRESALLDQRRLDELVGQVAERLMSASSRTRQNVLSWTIRVLAEFLGADVAFLRRNDHSRGLSILEAEWPPREIPDPDPLGEVPFDADPVFAALRNLRAPFYLTGRADAGDEYLDRVEKGSGVQLVGGGAAVPLLLADMTWGVLGFLHFGLHAWSPEEVSTLQAIASMLMQLQARIDAERRTEYNALHDDLTGLPNRRALLQELEDRLEAHRKTAVLFFDLDRFKVMNDFLGHASGDRVLTTIGDRIRTSIRPNDFAARLGGDEFVILVGEVSGEMEVMATAYRILGGIGEPIDFAGQQVSHTASVGIVLSRPGLRNGMELLGWADVAMYAAKRQGRNQAVVFDDVLQELVSERSKTELTLREAIESDGLRLHYQPEVDLRTGRLLAVEALVRWEHPTRGLLPASAFITVAEETGLVVDMGRWVFTEACRQLAAWRREYPDLPLIVRVNMSPAEFVISGLVEFVEDRLRVYDIPGERLCIEVTEHAVLQEPEQTARILRGFQALGVEIAIDDFGTGYASFTELKRLPVNLLKLDQTFVQGIITDPSDRAIVEAIIQLGRALDLGMIAEGIECSATIDKLLELGCHRGQGYLMSVPMSAEELAPVLNAGAIALSVFRPAGKVAPALADRSL
ncbi:MAG TPA: EAL domain-containing protein [Candidatus Dormibacteraeota bacterium]